MYGCSNPTLFDNFILKQQCGFRKMQCPTLPSNNVGKVEEVCR